MTSSNPGTDAEGIRLQKVLAQVGYGSRRKCEAMIDAGRVSVNNVVVVGQGKRVDPQSDVIRVDGDRISAPPQARVLAVNKPLGVLSAMSDDRGRPTLGDMLTDFDSTLRGFFHVGRLDQETMGLILLTNNGELSQLLAHPRHGVVKTYVARVKGELGPRPSRLLRSGVKIDDRVVQVSRLKVRAVSDGQTLVEISIHEGRKHIVRRVLDEVGHPVVELTRTKFGPIALGGRPTGEIWELADSQIASLYDAADAVAKSAGDS